MEENVLDSIFSFIYKNTKFYESLALFKAKKCKINHSNKAM